MGCNTSQRKVTLNGANQTIPNNSSCYLWKEYITTYKTLNSANSFRVNMIKYNNKAIEFDFVKVGEKPQEGYPLYICLHDGEVSHSAFNTSEYKKMKTLYLKSITVGICLACKGLSDQSNCHYMDESFVLVEKMIKEMIAVNDVDPNRVYLVGIGLGGDAVYQLAARLADRLAAISINSGHTYGMNLKNLVNLPIQIQVGENDNVFEKNKNAVNSYISLLELYKEYNLPQKELQCNIHSGKGKHIIDYYLKKSIQNVINDPIAWLNGGDFNIEQKNVNAITFLSQFTRCSFPNKLIWDLTKCFKSDPQNDNNALAQKKLSMPNLISKNEAQFQMEITLSHISGNSTMNINSASMGTNSHFYWLEIGNKNINEIGAVEIIAHYEKEKNKIVIETPVKYLRVLLCQEMIDFTKNVIIEINKEEHSIQVSRSFATERRSISERGDYSYIFSAVIEIESQDLVKYKVEQYKETIM